ncbi:MAG: VWA domain-containing protein [Verrucomicrobiae bacterium]|nr:VWA domain-containing protein [Verrucomicrobiae bacterium]NNJ44377.1 VWA domain-containing protein [Akkermansiaceae bacterium]
MNTKHITLGAAACAALITMTPVTAKNIALAGAPPEVEENSSQPNQAKVQIAILLDTSSSMSGLIEQTKTQLWKIVNTFIDAKQNGQVPYVEVALYEYGKSSLSKEENWIKRIQPLTRDLDEISKQLFALRTNGGDEFCGAVIQCATDDLMWDPSNKVYKAIFIAGNEAFTQGPVNATDAVKSAIAKGVIVNTIHCGSEQSGISGGWKKGATLADGKFLTIDHNRAVAHIEAPQDAEIVKLNAKLNRTYLAYGRIGVAKKREQATQDANAAAKSKSGADVQRAVTKGSANYSNTAWDLVDACKEENFDITKVKNDALPAVMQTMTMAQRKVHVATKSKERAAIQAQILELNNKRNTYVATKRKEQAEKTGVQTLDEVVAKTIREQAEKQGYAFKK